MCRRQFKKIDLESYKSKSSFKSPSFLVSPLFEYGKKVSFVIHKFKRDSHKNFFGFTTKLISSLRISNKAVGDGKNRNEDY